MYHLRMDLGLKGAVVLITGGSKGLGLAAARAFVAEGARVAIASRSHDNLQKARAELEAKVRSLAGAHADDYLAWVAALEGAAAVRLPSDWWPRRR